LTGSEISRWIRLNVPTLEVNNPTTIESDTMDSLWKEYERTIIWPGEVFEQEYPEVTPKTKLQIITDWENWAIENYRPESMLK
jgi:hypothetical protein